MISTVQEANIATVCSIEHDIVIGGIYRHYKGKLYRVLAVSRHVEDLSIWVVYECLYDNEVSAIWHRSLQEFTRIDVWVPGTEPCARFVYVSP